MSTSFNTKHYTYHLGTSLELNSCLTVYYYDSSKIYDQTRVKDASKPSIANIQEVFGDIQDYLTEIGQFCHRSDPDQDFELTEGGNKNPSFDTLIYVDHDGTSVLGFTFFLGLQSNKRGDSKIQNMYLGFKFSIVNKKVDIRISYTLDPVWSTKDPLLEDYFVTSREEILSASGPNPESDYLRYSDDLMQLNSSDNFVDVTDSGTLTRTKTWKFWIPDTISMSRIQDYTDYTVGLWRGSLVLYRWNSKGKFTIDSLTNTNHFGVMTHIMAGQVHWPEKAYLRTFMSGVAILDALDEDSGKISKSCGYVTVNDSHWYVNTKKRVITDPWSESDKLSIIDSNSTSESLELRYLLCPPGKYYFLVSKIGPWFKFQNEKSGVTAWSSLYGTAYFKDSEINVVPWSDRILLGITEDNIDVYSFDFDGQLGTKEYLISSTPSIRIPTEYLGSEYRPFLDSLRHRPLRPGSLKELHNSTVSFRGLLFYLESGFKNIHYL
jgi:hypothetical protein